MLSTKQNFHHSILPKLGEIGYLRIPKIEYGITENLYYRGKQLYQVISFPLCDNCLPYSKGIHTAYFQSLKDGTIHRLSGFYFEKSE